jgi:hypothetical protein
MLGAAPAYSAFAGILGGFVFLIIITLMTDRRDFTTAQTHGPQNAVTILPSKSTIDRTHALMLFLPAFLSLLVAAFLFGEVSGEQICARGYTEGMLAASLLAIGGLGIFSAISWMLDAYGESSEDLRRTALVFTYISYFVIVALLTESGIDVIQNALQNELPNYALIPLVVYGPLLLLLMVAARRWFTPSESRRSRAQLTVVYLPAAYIVIAVITYSILTSYSPGEWKSLNDWKAYLAVSIAMFFPAITMIAYARALPSMRRKKATSTTTKLPTQLSL